VARPLLVVMTAVTGGGILLAMGGWLLPVAIAVVVCAVMLLGPLRKESGKTFRPRLGEWRLFWTFAAPRAFSAAIDASSMWIGVLLCAGLSGSAAAGVFGAAGRYVLAGQLVMQGLRVAVAPQLSRLLGSGRTEEAAAVHRTITT
jgi:O-antigen/teichoic acid export membrane protein